MFSVKSIKSLGEKFLHFKTTSTCALDHLRPDVAHLRLRVREEGGGQRGQVRAPGPGRGAALHHRGLRVTLYAPSPTLSLCRHAEQGCGVAAKKSAYKRAISVNKTKIPTNNGAWAQGIQGGDCGMRWCRRCSSDPRPRDRAWPWRTLGGKLQPSLSLLHFYTSTTVGARLVPRVTTTTSCSASPALEDSVFKIIIVIYNIYVMSIKIASWVAGNVVTFLQP